LSAALCFYCFKKREGEKAVAQSSFNDLEALEVAINIERRGERFYSQATELAPNDVVKRMLMDLADQERDHADTFQGLYNEISKTKQDFDDTYLYDPEVAAYLRAMTQNTVFPSDSRQQEVIDGLQSITEVFEVGIQAEKDSILFYTEMTINARDMEAKEAFRRLMKEEKKHLVDLQGKLNQYRKA
jgi:rubrerythrin